MNNPENDHEELDAETRAIVRAAAELPTLKPSRDLWAGIAARIEAPVVALPVQHEAPARRVAPTWKRTWPGRRARRPTKFATRLDVW